MHSISAIKRTKMENGEMRLLMSDNLKTDFLKKTYNCFSEGWSFECGEDRTGEHFLRVEVEGGNHI
jgi:hypothetical protein